MSGNQFGEYFQGDVRLVGGTVDGITNLLGGTLTRLNNLGTVAEISSLKTIVGGTVQEVSSVKTIVGGTISELSSLLGGTLTRLNNVGTIAEVSSIKTVIGGTLDYIKGVMLAGGTIDSITVVVGTFQAGTITGLAGTIQEVSSLKTIVGGTVSELTSLLGGSLTRIATVGTVLDVESIKTIIGGTISEVASIKTIVGGTIQEIANLKQGTISDIESIKTIVGGTISELTSLLGGTVTRLNTVGTITEVASIKTIIAGTISDIESLKTIVGGTINEITSLLAGSLTRVAIVGTVLDVESIKTIVGGSLNSVGVASGTNVADVDYTKSLVVMDIAHHLVHDGKHFVFTNDDTEVDTTAPKYYGIETGTYNEYHAYLEINSSGAGLIEMFEDAQVGGSSGFITGRNRNRKNTGTTFLTVKADVTLASGTGNAIYSKRLGAAGAIRINEREGELILKSAGTYAVVFTPDADNAKVSFLFDIYEI